MRQPSLLHRLARRFVDAIDALCILILVAIAAVILIQVVARYWFESPTSWSEEAARYLLVWLAMLGAAALTPEGGHIRVDFLVTRLPRPVQNVLAVVRDGLTLGMCGLLAWYGSGLVQVGTRSQSTSLGVEMAIPYLAIPLSAALIAVALVLKRTADVAKAEEQSDGR